MNKTSLQTINQWSILTYLRFLALLCIAMLSDGCRHYMNVPVEITSNPSNARIEIDGADRGRTPLNYSFPVQKVWVGLLNAPNGWMYRSSEHKIAAFPDSNSLLSQTKIITPAKMISGGNIHFDLTHNIHNSVQPLQVITFHDAASDSKLERLEKLKTFYDKGLISKSEYESKKKEILDSL